MADTWPGVEEALEVDSLSVITGPLEEFARTLASQHEIATHLERKSGRVAVKPLRPLFIVYAEQLRRAVNHFRVSAEKDMVLSYAAEWVLDNSHIAQNALRELQSDLPPEYYLSLPILSQGSLAGYPRVYALARAWISVEHAQLDFKRLQGLIQVYQQQSPLTIGELWALPAMLRLVMIQGLLTAVNRMTHQEELPLAFDLTETLTDDEAIANTVTGLRALAAQDWKHFFESVSLVEGILTRDPTRVYSQMEFQTRDQYRKVVEEIALESKVDEHRVAQEAVRLAQSAVDRGELGAPEETSTRTDRHQPPIDGREPRPRIPHLRVPGLEYPRNYHVGYYLLEKGRAELEHRLGYRPSGGSRLKRWVSQNPTFIYLGSIWLVAALIVAGLGYAVWLITESTWGGLATALLTVIPALTLAVDLMNWIFTNTNGARVLPKLDFTAGIPEQYTTLVAVPALLAHEDDVTRLARQIELHYVRNPYENLYFALLTDFSDAPSQHMPEDDGLVEAGRRAIEELNQRYGQNGGGPFLLLHRERRWNEGEGYWIGWERKRGKLEELNRMILRGEDTSYRVRVGNMRGLEDVRYVVTLDADTIMPRESVPRLVGTLAHPLNRADFDERGRVTAGYTVLQPRVEINLTGLPQSLFSRVYALDRGLDLYTLAVSDVYQDLFGEGIYVGKGIYDVAAFERSLAGRVPENALLSHDLFEGLNGRAALVSDIVLIEDFPPNYLVYMQRLHRWVRGDWQLLPWLGVRPPFKGEAGPDPLDVIDHWKIFDNLRRSLAPVAVLALLAAGWLGLLPSPVVWTLVAVLAYGGLITIFDGLKEAFLGISEANRWLRWLTALVFLPYEVLVHLDAIFTTLYRLLISRRNLLQWTTAAQAAERFQDGMGSRTAWRLMWPAVGLALLLGSLVGWLNPAAMPVAGPFLLAWILAPQVAGWISQPQIKAPVELPRAAFKELPDLARRTWMFFEQYLGPEDNWLPPDNFQESPLGVVAHRTSPTNIGLALDATLAAYDMGYLGLLDLNSRLRSSFESLERLERYQGHFLNWYDTQSLQPLPPAYVSTVDSGNMAASLIALAKGLEELPGQTILRAEVWEGFNDLLGLLLDLVAELVKRGPRGDGLEQLHAFLSQVQTRVLAQQATPQGRILLLEELAPRAGQSGSIRQELEEQLLALVESNGDSLTPHDLRRLRILIHQLRAQLDNNSREIAVLMPWVWLLDEAPEPLTDETTGGSFRVDWQKLFSALQLEITLEQASQLPGSLAEPLSAIRAGMPEAVEWCEALEREVEEGALAAKALLIGSETIRQQAQLYVDEMDFSFLFNQQRKIFHIGMNVSTGKHDANYYDLLASEARIASLVAIAKGDVPQDHWLHLARPVTRVGNNLALLSWGATMFEYLMPLLLVRSYEGTLLHNTALAVTRRQIEYGEENQIPWGISESGYYHFDAGQYYQYRAFGVPGLGYKRDLGDDRVITPYASVLALPLRPREVLRNLKRLEKLNALGPYGFYEALDFTPNRLAVGQTYEIVCSYMAHHQAMIFLSLANQLCGNRMVERFHADRRIEGIELLLKEQVPQAVSVEYPHSEERRDIRPVKPRVNAVPWQVPDRLAWPQAHYLSNGRYGVMVTSAGGGYSTWKEMDLTRWRPDSTQDNWGTWIYIQDQESGDLWSAAHQPTGVEARTREVSFSAYAVDFLRRDQDISALTELTVSPDDDVEVRRLTLTNHSDRTRTLRVTSYGEVVMAPQASDQRHPAFNKLFIESEYLPDLCALVFRRRPRSSEEAPVFMAHCLVAEPGRINEPTFESDRLRFLGRGHEVRRPQVLAGGQNLSGTTGATLDPVFALQHEVELPPHGTVQLAFLTVASETYASLREVIVRYQGWSMVNQIFQRARARAEVDMLRLGLNTDKLERIQQVFSALVYPQPRLRVEPHVLAANTLGQPGLWAYGISGDHPIVLVRIDELGQLSLVHEMIQAHAYWRRRRLRIDLVILNVKGSDYDGELNNRLLRLIHRRDSEAWLNRRGGIFLLSVDRMGEAEQVLLASAARVVLDGNKGLLSEQLRQSTPPGNRLPPFNPSQPPGEVDEPTPALERPDGLLFDNGLGGFSPDGREYVIYLEPGKWTPAPWVNVIANEAFGCLVSEAGSSFTWSLNSGENRLTPWNNDPVSDSPGEALYLRDEVSGEVWSPTRLPAGPGAHLIRHGAGYTLNEHHSHGLKQQVRWFVAPDAPVKIIQLRLENTWQRNRRITSTFYAEWVLGVQRESSQQYVIPEYSSEPQALLARNPYSVEFGDRVAFVAASKPIHSLTTNRAEFLGRTGSRELPAGLRRIGLSGNVTAGRDPCAALMVHVDLEPGEVEEITFILGQGESRQQAL